MRPVARRRDITQTIRRRQAQGDRQPHVRRGRLADGRSVHELHHRVHDGLRVHGHDDAIRRHVEQTARLDDLQSLVHQGGRVDGHHGSHMPRGVVECLFRGDVAHVGALPAAEGTARGRDDQSADLGVGAGPQRLPDGGMLRVDGIDLVIAHLRAEKQVTACDDRFLVGERQLRTSPQRRNGWFESDRARDAVQHLLCQKPHMRASGGQTGDGEPLRMPTDDIQTLRADRTGRSENDNRIPILAHCNASLCLLWCICLPAPTKWSVVVLAETAQSAIELARVERGERQVGDVEIELAFRAEVHAGVCAASSTA